MVTPWYPDDASVYLGVFVRQQVEALRREGLQVEVEVPQLFPAPAGPLPTTVTDAIGKLARHDPEAVYPSRNGVTWVPAPVPARSGYAGRAHAYSRAIGQKREVLPVGADVTHAHLGVPTGAALVELGDRPLIVTEHQSTLDNVLREPAARDLYRMVIEQSDGFFVVSRHLARRLGDEFGDEIGRRIGIMPNIVDLTDIPFAKLAEFTCSRWIYVGALTAHKGGRLLIRSFVEYRRRFDRAATLTVVGDGDLAEWAVRFCDLHQCSDGLHLIGPVPHAELADHLGAADLMVHLSPAETFGIASLEAIGSGIPVVSLRNGGAEDNWGEIESTAGVLLDADSSAEDVANAVDRLRCDSQTLDLAGARQFVEERFAPSVIARRLISTYERVATP